MQPWLSPDTIQTILNLKTNQWAKVISPKLKDKQFESITLDSIWAGSEGFVFKLVFNTHDSICVDTDDLEAADLI